MMKTSAPCSFDLFYACALPGRQLSLLPINLHQNIAIMTKASTSPPSSKVSKAGTKPKSTGSPKNSGGGGGGSQRILDFVLAMEGKLNTLQIPRKTVMAASGVKSNTFPVTISGMKKKGLIDYNKDFIMLTDAGRSKANPDAILQGGLDNESAQEDNIRRFKIGGKALLLFNAMRDGQVHDRMALAEQVSITNKATLAVMLSNLKKSGVFLVTKTTIQLSDMNFPLGRPTENDGDATSET